MYCNNCGEKIETRSEYCEFCGARLHIDKECQDTTRIKTRIPKTSNKKMSVKPVRIVVLMAVFVIIIGFGFVCFNLSKVAKHIYTYNTTKYEYGLDDNGKLTYCRYYKDINKKPTNEYIYDEAGEINIGKKEGEIIYKKEFDISGRVTYIKDQEHGGETEYEYYDSGEYGVTNYRDGVRKSIRRYDVNGVPVKTYSEDKGMLTFKNQYDDKNRIIRSTSYDEDDSIYLSLSYSYDKFGNLVETNFYKGDEDYYPVSSFTQAYDDNNLLIHWKDTWYNLEDMTSEYREGAYQYEFDTNNRVVGYTFRQHNMDAGESISESYEYDQSGNIIKIIHRDDSFGAHTVEEKEYYEGYPSFDMIKPTAGESIRFADDSFGFLYGDLHVENADYDAKLKSSRRDDMDGSFEYSEWDADGKLLVSESFDAYRNIYEKNVYGDLRTYGVEGEGNCINVKIDNIYIENDSDTGEEISNEYQYTKPVIRGNVTKFHIKSYEDGKYKTEEFVVIKKNGNDYQKYIFRMGKGNSIRTKIIEWLLMRKI